MKDEMSVYIVWCGEYVVPIMKSIYIILKYGINKSKTQNKNSVVFVYAYRGFDSRWTLNTRHLFNYHGVNKRGDAGTNGEEAV